MPRQIRSAFASLIIIAAAAALIACGGGASKATPTPRATSTPTPAATATPEAIVPLPPTNTPEPAFTSTPAPFVDACSLFPEQKQWYANSPAFALNVDVRWQLCVTNANAGTSEKYLFRTSDSGASWKLISETTIGNPTPQAGVGQLPNRGTAVQILFLNETDGWLGLNGPGLNLWRSQDSGVTWSSISAIPSAVPVTSITFTDSQHGTVRTPEGNCTTSDGGITWTPP